MESIGLCLSKGIFFAESRRGERWQTSPTFPPSGWRQERKGVMRVREEIIEVLEVQMRRERRCERGKRVHWMTASEEWRITKTEMRWPLLQVIFCTGVMGATALKIERSPWELNSAAHFHTLAKDDPISSAFFHNTHWMRNISHS